jgi:hypothetical protein
MMGRACVASMRDDALGNVMEALKLCQPVEQDAIGMRSLCVGGGQPPSIGCGPIPEFLGVEDLAAIKAAVGVNAGAAANVSCIVTPAGMGVGAIGLLVDDFATAIDG